MIKLKQINEAKKFETIREYINSAIEKYADKNAFIIKNKKNDYKYITYKQLGEDIENLGTGLLSLGLENKRIAIIGKNSYEWALSYISIFNGVGITVPLDKGLQENEIIMSLDRSKADAVYSTDVNMAFLPFHHTFGSTGLLLFLSNGATNVFCDGLRYIQENLKEYKVTAFVCVPLLLEAMYKKIMPEETDKVLKDGWFYTGDLGYIDKDGFLFITGRKKNVIVLKNGKNIYPEEIEQLISNLPYVEENMVFGKEHNDDLLLSVKIVYNKEYVNEKYPNISQEELKEIIWKDIKEINKTFPKYKYIKNLIITDEPMIKTTTQKVKRYEEMKKL